jgi:competence protein ComEC
MKGLNPASLIELQSDRPVVAVTLSFAAGIAVSLSSRQYSFWGLAAAGMALAAASFLACRRDRIPLAFVLAQTAVLMAGMLTGLAHRDGYDERDLRFLLERHIFPLQEPVLFEGRIIEESPMAGEEIETVVDIRRYRVKGAWTSCSGKGLLRIAPPDPAAYGQLRDSLMPGTTLRTWAAWNIPRNFENPGSADRAGSLARRGIYLIGRTKSPRLIESVSQVSSNPLTPMAHSVRSRVWDMLNSIQQDGGGQPAAVLASLLIGDYSALDGKTREAFQNSGTFHILVVSGLHVAWLAGAWLVLAKFSRIPERIRYLSAAMVIFLYAWIVGFQAGIIRCLWMFLLYLIGRMILRKTDVLNVLFSAALLLLAAHPDWLLETGFQLSFLSVTAIAMTAVPAINLRLKPLLEPLKYAGRPDRLFLETGRPHRWGRMLRARCELFTEWAADSLPSMIAGILHIAFRFAAAAGFAVGSMFLLSVSVQIWLTPLLAFHFNRISWIAPLSNPMIVPMSSLTLASGILASFFADIPCFGPALVKLAGTSASLLLNVTERITGIPGAWQRCPTPSSSWILAGLLLLFAWSFFRWNRGWMPWGYSLILTAVLACGSSPYVKSFVQGLRNLNLDDKAKQWSKNAPFLSLTFLDVGEGDAIVIRFPNGDLWVLDAGGLRRTSPGKDADVAFDMGEAVVSRYLWHEWAGNPDRVILSHTDIDHAGGIPALLNNFKIRRLDYPRCMPDAILDNILETARNRRAPAKQLHSGMEERIGHVAVCVLHPSSHTIEPSTNENSIVLSLSFKRFSALLTGDLEKKGEAELLSHPGTLHSLLLKVAHHGSRSGTSSAFLDAVRPRWAVLSVGRNNPFGHPSPEVLNRLSRHGTRAYQTPDEGAITFATDGASYEIRSHIHGLLEKGMLE